MQLLDNNKNREDILEFDGIKYKVIENRIHKGKKKNRLVLLMNLFALVMIFVVMILYSYIRSIFFPLAETGSFNITSIRDMIMPLLFFVGFMAFICIHEYVHWLAYYTFGKVKKKNLKFGIVPKMGMAYCISLVPNTIKTSRLSLMMPLYVLVIPLFIVSVLTGSVGLAFFTALCASGSAGDLWYMWTLRKTNKDLYMIECMPEKGGYELGYYLLDKVEE